MRYARQHLYASYDFALYRGEPQPALDVWKQMTAAKPYAYAPEPQVPGPFLHLARR